MTGRRVVSLRIIIFCLVAISGWGAEPGWRVLPGQVPTAVANLAPLQALPLTNELSLHIGLPLHHRDQLNALIEQLYDPGSTNYHKFLPPGEFDRRFGPTAGDYQAVIQFAAEHGLKIARQHESRMVLDVTGNVGNIQRAFQVRLHTYKHPVEHRNFFAPDTEPLVPTNLPIADISGFSDYSLPKPALVKAAAVSGQPLNYNGSGPGGEYQGADFRRAYLPGSSLNGAGQTVALVELDGYFSNDVSNYETQCGIPAVILQNVLLDGMSGAPSSNLNQVLEVSLDIEMVVAMAPGLSGVVVYEGNNAFDIYDAIATADSASQVSSSWTFDAGPGANWPGNPGGTLDSLLSKMVAQGQDFFQASGDGDAYAGANSISSTQGPIPVDSIYVTSVGGTSLTMTGGGNSWSSETVWNWNDGKGSSGGISFNYTIPSWQNLVNTTTNGGSANYRNIPDVALTADAIYAIYNNGQGTVIGGTSAAAPLWAGFCALINQQASGSGDNPAGFLNPALYQIAQGTNYTACFHDITTGNNESSASPRRYRAGVGYDLCTGLGTPNGTNLINVLAPLAQPFFISQPADWNVTNGAGFTLSATVSGAPSLGCNWFFNGTNLSDGGNISGSATPSLSFAGITTNQAGNYTLVVTNTYGAVTSSVAMVTVGYAPTMVTQPTNIVIMMGSNVTLVAAAAGSPSLVYQWQQNGNNLMDGGAVSGSQDNVLALANVGATNSGKYKLVVTNLYGSVTSLVAMVTVEIPTTGQLVSSENPAGFGDVLNFTNFILPAAATGPVAFYVTNATQPFDVETLTNGMAVSTNCSSLPRGTNTVTAIYYGHGGYLPLTNMLYQVVTNHPPTAVPASFLRPAGASLNIAVTNLAAGWSDVDGDAISLVGVSVSTNGATITNESGTLVYFDTNNVSDQFTCTITDGYGGTNYQTVNITVVFPGISVAPGDTNGIILQLSGVPAQTYILESTTNLLPPVIWQPLATNQIGTNGIWLFTDSQYTNYNQRFYQLHLAP